MRSSLWLLPLVLVACGRGGGGDTTQLGPRFAEVAQRETARRGSDRLEAALAKFATVSSEVHDMRRALEGDAGLSLASAPPELAAAIADLLAAEERDERLPDGDCGGNVIDLFDFVQAVIVSAPPGDARQLEAAAWFATRIREDRTSLLGAMIGVDAARDALARAKALGVRLSAAVGAAVPTEGFVARSFAREAMCTATLMARSVEEMGEHEALARGLVDGQRAALVALQERTLEAIVLAPTTAEAIAVITRASEEAAQADSELVRMSFGGMGYDRLEASRQEALALLAEVTPAPEPTAPPHLELTRDALASAVAEEGGLLLVPDPRGVRLMNLNPEHPWFAWGARHGDLLQRVDDAVIGPSGGLAERLGALTVGAHRLTLARRDREVVLPFTLVDPDAPYVVPRARVADPAALRRELEGSGLTLAYDAKARAFIVGGVLPGTLGELLGLRDGDELSSIGTHFAYEAHDTGQTGHAFLVDGLEVGTSGAVVRRGERLARLRWSIE